MVTVVSGGQTGVDRAALDAGLAAGLPYRGWCPQGGWAEDWPEPPGVFACYPGLKETPARVPEQRTEWNVRDSDALLVLVDGRGLTVSKGTALAVEKAQALGKPHVVIDMDSPDALRQMEDVLRERGAQAICIAGPRESEAPGIYDKAKALLMQTLAANRA